MIKKAEKQINFTAYSMLV